MICNIIIVKSTLYIHCPHKQTDSLNKLYFLTAIAIVKLPIQKYTSHAGDIVAMTIIQPGFIIFAEVIFWCKVS